jgi:hypothetical protein
VRDTFSRSRTHQQLVLDSRLKIFFFWSEGFGSDLLIRLFTLITLKKQFPQLPEKGLRVAARKGLLLPCVKNARLGNRTGAQKGSKPVPNLKTPFSVGWSSPGALCVQQVARFQKTGNTSKIRLTVRGSTRLQILRFCPIWGVLGRFLVVRLFTLVKG